MKKRTVSSGCVCFRAGVRESIYTRGSQVLDGQVELMTVMLPRYLGTWPTSAAILLLWLQRDKLRVKTAGKRKCATLGLSREKQKNSS